MGDKTAIEWAANADGSPGATWNPIRARHKETGAVGWHCVHASDGCRFCYAERLNVDRFGTGEPFTKQAEERVEVFLDQDTLGKPFSWRRPRTIFVCSMTDLFGDFVRAEWLHRVFAVMALNPRHTFIVVTKRAERMRDMLDTRGPMFALVVQTAIGMQAARGVPLIDRDAPPMVWPLPNVWLCVSAEAQREANERVPLLLQTPAAVRGVSAEPLLGPIDFKRLREFTGNPIVNALRGLVTHGDHLARNPSECSINTRTQVSPPELPALDWVIVGGESGPHARPMATDWARSIRDQCDEAGLPFFFKQHGEHLHGVRVGKKRAGRLLDGREHNARPSFERKA